MLFFSYKSPFNSQEGWSGQEAWKVEGWNQWLSGYFHPCLRSWDPGMFRILLDCALATQGQIRPFYPHLPVSKLPRTPGYSWGIPTSDFLPPSLSGDTGHNLEENVDISSDCKLSLHSGICNLTWCSLTWEILFQICVQPKSENACLCKIQQCFWMEKILS